ncbi:hypothetical protein [Petrotoga sp. 9PWA.NaAc.5.4]|uniref:hypothetical protein n=1 Tax=Petrotoga sp. 9PWA.NaAc.5.4 TaxID=1434328 RepID=UPI000CAF9E55|nr:hypothetical protein [Petrotoga sp. 9PWA.NaAc.5.4]PNR93998.1 hypothetical protein X924_07240 [Petrotoga sp. 9PWA.NaAc.5.4]
MKKIAIMVGILVLVVSIFSAPLAVGIKVGEPTGLYVRNYMGNNHIGFTAAWSFSHNSFDLYGDYNWIYPNLLQGIDFHYGLGAVARVREESFNVGLRFPFSFNYDFPQVPIVVFLEVAPGIGIIPDFKFNIGGGLGFAYKF